MELETLPMITLSMVVFPDLPTMIVPQAKRAAVSRMTLSG